MGAKCVQITEAPCFVAVQYYQEFACCAAVHGNGLNKEYALHLLHITKGDIKVRLADTNTTHTHSHKENALKLMQTPREGRTRTGIQAT